MEGKTVYNKAVRNKSIMTEKKIDNVKNCEKIPENHKKEIFQVWVKIVALVTLRGEWVILQMPWEKIRECFGGFTIKRPLMVLLTHI